MKLVDREVVDGTKITIGRRVYYNYSEKKTSKYYAAEYRDDTGKQVCENLKVKTKAQARRKAIEIAQRLEQGQAKIVETKLTVEELIEGYFEMVKARGLAKKSQAKYRTDLDKLEKFCRQQKIKLAYRFNRDLFFKYRTWLVDQEYADKTVYGALILTKQVFKWGYQEGQLREYKLVNAKVAKAHAKPQPCFTTDEVELILANTYGEERIVFATLAYEGLRVGELEQLQWDDVNLANGDLGMMHICRGGSTPGKTKSKRDRFVPIHPRVRPMLEALPRKRDEPLVFPGVTERKMLKRLKAVCKEIGLANAQSYKLHSFRHHFASMCANHQVAYKKALAWLGHRSSDILDLYYHLNDAESQSAMASLSEDTFPVLPHVASRANSEREGKTRANVLGTPSLAWSSPLAKTTRIDHWDKTHDRVFLGGGVWANPMEDWRVQDGWAACQTTGAGRNIQSLLCELTDAGEAFTVSVEVHRPEKLAKDGGAGFRLGVSADIDDYRASCFANNGINAGLQGDTLILGRAKQKIQTAVPNHIVLMLVGKPGVEQAELTLSVADPASGEVIGSITQSIPNQQLQGNLALASQFTGPKGRPQSPGYRFRDWRISGDAFTHHPDRAFGPILWSMYSLSDNRDEEGFVMKLTALLGPMGEKDNKTVELWIQPRHTRSEQYQKIATAQLDPDSHIAAFRVPNWDKSRDTPYRVTYYEKQKNRESKPHVWFGRIKANPTKPLRIGALTCQNAVGFPYQPVVDNLKKLEPDLLFFSGDQLYENHGGFGVIRKPADPAILNYLRKFYMFGWAFRKPMAHAPTIVLPDDHDVFHGNIWGEAGKPIDGKSTSSSGGYIQPAKMVNVVHKTSCSHHPDIADPTPVQQGISVYYGDMVYGDVGFAIIADRQWKSAPAKSGNKSGRVDHVTDPTFDTSTFDKPGLVLLGERQEEFLEEWAGDWRGHTMKVVLSQTVFAGAATHHGRYDGYLYADLDSGAWPQTPRNRTIDILLEAMPLHICGDQHLASAVQYGVDKQRDSNWAFCTPAISVGYQRWWRPDELDNMPHTNRPAHGLPNTGEYIDGMGNKFYVYAIANPGKDFRAGGGNRYDLAHRKNSGFGLVTIDTDAKTYTLACYKFLIDATDGKASNQFPGWPVTIHRSENKGENRVN
eukprot:g12134.t1